VLSGFLISYSGEFAESVIGVMIDAVMDAAIEFIETGRRLSRNAFEQLQ